MKRIYLLLLLAIFTTGIAAAQNANRHGFFLEIGVGGLVGNTPRSSFSVTDNVMFYKCLTGATGDFGFGGRFRLGNHWAYELKVEAQLPFYDPIYSLVGRGLPIGFRYTSPELYRNYSLYTHINLGGAITINRGIMNLHNIVLQPKMEETKLKELGGGGIGLGYGAAYSIGVGVNVTTHFYVECAFNGQAIFQSYGKDGYGPHNYGVVGFIAGYRF